MDLNFSLGGIMALEGRCAVVSGGLSHQVCLPEKDWTLHFGAGFFAGVLQTGDRDQSNDALYNHAWRSTLGSYVSASIEFRPVESRLMFFADMRPAISFRPVLDFYPYNLLGTGVRYYFRKPSK
jgi:hypothetical protein